MTETYMPLNSAQLEGLLGAEHKPTNIDYVRDHLDDLCQSLISRGESQEDILNILDENMVVGVLGLKQTREDKLWNFAGAAFTGLIFGGLAYAIGNKFVSEQYKGWLVAFSILTGLATIYKAYSMEAEDLGDSMVNAYQQIASSYNISLE